MNENTRQALEGLNFSSILRYEKPVKRCCRSNDGESPLHKCTGFCHDCEDKGIVPKGGSSSILMSHGCSSDDFVSIIGKPLPKVKCDLPIMFLLENPGGDYGNGEAVTCNGVIKNPPINHFYFSSGLTQWPTEIADIKIHYGDYFAYLMARFGLSNVYITNCIKCKYTDAYYDKTAENCIKRFLEREIRIFSPRLIVCFSKQVSDELLYKKIQDPGKLKKVCLLHPAADSRPKWRNNWEGIVRENDTRLAKALAEVVSSEI